ncbi:ATP-binding protein [Stigmatella sp. ncwal1]|uniref:histidine kinase n=1 Tax=Stigmatella ashevillensis TaxID=2995309 RepID=A0ABT5D0P7_9BACT|nr:ATP-binding protein [Stigmatella ashevillena]MDC0707247.1 ATP-binding protein [Stigmatella ashevillena]
MDIPTQNALFASLVGLALGLAMLLRSGRSRAMTLYSLFAFTVAGYYLASFVYSVVSPTESPWASRIAVGATLFLLSMVPGSAVGFFLEFLSVSKSTHVLGRRLSLLSAVLGLAVAVTPLAERSWAQLTLSVWVLGALLISVSLLFLRVRNQQSRIERLRMTYLAIGAGVSILLSLLDLVSGHYDIPLPSLGAVFTTLYLVFLYQTLRRLRLMDLNELLGKLASQAVLAVLLAAVFTVLTSWVKENILQLLFNTVVATFVIIILLEPLGARVDAQMVRILFRERFELLGALGTLQARMATVIDIAEVTRMALDAIHETGRVTHVSIYLLAEDRPGYRLLDSRGPPPEVFLDTAAARGLLLAVASGQKAVLLENLDSRVKALRAQLTEGKRFRDELKRLNDTRAALVKMQAGITVPLVGNDRVIGFLNLWDERVPEAYASDEIALILKVAERLATVLENSKLYEKIRERDRLAALGEMAAGLAHEIRNPLGAIKGAAQCLDPRRLPGEDGEFLGVIVEEVNRLNGVVTAFLDYARPLKQNFGPTDLNEVVTRTMRLIQNDVPKEMNLAVELDLTVPKVDADAEQLKQVLINLVQNAVQAIGPSAGRITVRTLKPDRFGDFRSNVAESVEVHVFDTGPGIPTEQQQHIFVPFFTTKEKGTGLGLAICQRIVKNHGGSISVQSKPGEGCTFIVRFPALPSEQPPAEVAPAPEWTPMSLPHSSKDLPRETLRDGPLPQTPESRSKREKKSKSL